MFFFFSFLVMCDIGFVNNVSVISQNPKVTAINSCIEVDLTGQVCADSIGTRMYSGQLTLLVVRMLVNAVSAVELWLRS